MTLAPVLLGGIFAAALGWHARCAVRPGDTRYGRIHRRVESATHAVMAATMLAMLAAEVLNVPRAVLAVGVALQVAGAIAGAWLQDRGGAEAGAVVGPAAGAVPNHRATRDLVVRRLGEAVMAVAMVVMVLEHGGSAEVQPLPTAGHVHLATGALLGTQVVAGLVAVGLAGLALAWDRTRRVHARHDAVAFAVMALAMAAAMVVHQ